MKLIPQRWIDSIVKLHFLFLPFGSLDFGNPYLSINFITSILLVLTINFKIITIFFVKEYRGIVWPLILYLIYFLVISLTNYRSDVNTASSEVRMQTLFIVSFFSLIAYFHQNCVKLNWVSQYVNLGLRFLVVLAALGIGVEEVGAYSRISVFGMNPNLISFFLLYFILVNVHYLFYSRDFRGNFEKIFFLGLSLFVFIKLGSLSALLLLLVGLVVYFLLKERDLIKRLRLLLVGMLLTFPLIFFIIKSEVYSIRLSDKENIESYSGRKSFWDLGVSIFEKKPLSGIGVYESAFIRYSDLGFEVSLHNVYLEILVNTGVIGLMLFLIFLGNLFIRMWRLSKIYFNPLYVVFWLIPVISIFSGQFSFMFFTFLIHFCWPVNQN